jgi:hypothetical protein
MDKRGALFLLAEIIASVVGSTFLYFSSGSQIALASLIGSTMLILLLRINRMELRK